MQYLLIYASVNGQTKKIADRIAATILQQGHHLEMVSIADAPASLDSFDYVILGSRIRFGSHDKAITDFVKKHNAWLDQHLSAFFSVSLVARKTEKSLPETNRYCQKFLAKTHWQPTQTAVFAGKLDYSLYNFWQKRIICLIMWMTNGPTDYSTKQEFTNWDAVDKFSNQLIQQ
ncbi:MAG: menaquinone-dependent protoporphyrinogen IX dehydrogenase [Cellvibrionales bacterium]|nr:menaquinone-dependent protoporphyrinogen IX dehydrogenase [Cellvibrionales bacterium]